MNNKNKTYFTMKLNFLKFALLSIILVAGSSCVKENVDNTENFDVKTASFLLAQSRLTLDGTSFAFETGDKVGICFNNGKDLNVEGTVTVNGDATTVEFSYTGDIDGTPMLVYHPYSTANNGKAFGSLQLTVSPRQTQAVEGVYNGDNLPLLSEVLSYCGDDTTVILENLGAVIKFNVYGKADEKVKNVSIATDNQGKVYSSGTATVSNIHKRTIGTANDNGVDVTLATPTYSGASKENGTIAYATVFGFGAGERTYNAYVAVTTDKALYTWTRNITCAKGTGTTINLNLATADDEYPVKTYTTTATGRMASQIYNANNEREYVMGERTWMTANLRWRGYTGDLGTASTDATYAKQFGTYYNYYEAVSTIKDATWTLANSSVGKKAMTEGTTALDEMGLNISYKMVTTGVGQDGKATTKNLNVPLNPTSEDGKTLRGQWQFVCPKGWHLSNYTDWYHLAIAVADTYARGTSWSNGEVGFSESTFDTTAGEKGIAASAKNPFCNAALSCRADDATNAPLSMGFVFGQTIYTDLLKDGEATKAERGTFWGMAVGAWLRAGLNQKHGGPWADHLTNDTENGWWYKFNDTYSHLALFISEASYTALNAVRGGNTYKPSIYLVNAGYGTDKVGAEYVGFNAYPAGAASFTTSGLIYRYACFLQPMTINAKGNNGTTPFIQIDYNRNGIRMINGKGRTPDTSNKVSVRCVKNYEHYDLK